MKFNPNLKSIEITTEIDYTHEMILISVSEMQAWALRSAIGDEIVVSYENGRHPCLHFELPYVEKDFYWDVPDNAKSISWSDWIDSKIITFCWVAYMDSNDKLNFVDSSFPVKS